MKRHLAAQVSPCVAVASIALTGCGRDEDSGAGGEAQSEEIAEGQAKGDIEVWAMGTEGEMLEEFSAAFRRPTRTPT